MIDNEEIKACIAEARTAGALSDDERFQARQKIALALLASPGAREIVSYYGNFTAACDKIAEWVLD